MDHDPKGEAASIGAAEALWRSTQDGVALLEPDPSAGLRLLACNPTFSSQLGTQASWLSGASDAAISPPVAPAELADLEQRVRWALDHEQELSYGIVESEPTGRNALSVRLVPLDSRRVLAILRDMSEVADLSRTRRELEAQAGAGTWVWDLVRDQLQWSPQLRRLFGVGAHQPATITQALELVHRDDRPMVEAALERVQRTRRSEVFTHRVLRPDGTEREVRATARSVADEHGEVVRLFGSVQDITDQRRLEQAKQARQGADQQLLEALELNDEVMQALARAWLALDLNRYDDAKQAVVEGTEVVGRILGELLAGTRRSGRGHLEPGDLRRSAGSEPR